ncbi:Transposase and inactivated derivatives [Edwardsiella tarda]|nr:Transposase and inactivated derivatives [Edwardsiella tarda]
MRSRGSKKHPDIVGDNGLGRSRGGFGTKIHLATDGGGLPLNIVLSPGQAHESQFAQRLLDGIGIQRQNGSMKRRGHAVLRRIATRYDKTARNYLAMVKLGCIRLFYKKLYN